MLKSSHYLSLLIFSLFFSSSLFAQIPKIEWGSSTNISNDPRIFSLIGNDNLGYFALEYFPNDMKANILGGMASKNPYLNKNTLSMNLIHYGKDLQQINSKTLDLGGKGKKRMLKRMLLSQGKLFVFSSLLDVKARKHGLYLQEIDPSSLENKRPARLISEISFPTTKPTVMGGFSYKLKPSQSLIGSFDISWNNDSSKVLVSAFPAAKDKQAKTYRYGDGEFILLDGQMEEVWRDEMSIFPEKAYASIPRPLVDSEGNLYLFSNNMTQEEYQTFRKQKEKSYSYRIFAYKQQKKQMQLLGKVFETGNKGIQDRSLTLNSKGELICTGVYSCQKYESGFSNAFGGTFFLRLDPNSGNILSESFEEFDLDFIAKGTGWSKKDLLKEKSKGKVVELDEHTYSLSAIINRKDGGITQVYESNSVGPSSSGGYTVFRSNDIMLISINPEGKLVWTKFINKYQRMPEGMEIYNSHLLFLQGSQLYFLFNDSGKNSSLKNIQYPDTFKNPKKSRLVLVKINADGTFKKHLLNKFEDSQVALMPTSLIQNHAGGVLFLGQFSKKRRLGRIEFK